MFILGLEMVLGILLVLKTCKWLERKIGNAGFNILYKVFWHYLAFHFDQDF